MAMQSPIRLENDSRVTFLRSFHVELLRGGMNRLLLRSMPTADQPTRVEIYFQYVQHLDIPMSFERLVISDVTRSEEGNARYDDFLRRYARCRIYRLESGGVRAGEIVASACMFGEDSAPLGAESMFPMMT